MREDTRNDKKPKEVNKEQGCNKEKQRRKESKNKIIGIEDCKESSEGLSRCIRGFRE